MNGKSPEIRYTAEGKSVANFSIGTAERKKDGNGELNEHTEWHRITVWGKRAEVYTEWLNKSGLVFIEGKLRNRSYEDKEGVKRYVTEVIAQNIKLLGRASKKEEVEVVEPEPGVLDF